MSKEMTIRVANGWMMLGFNLLLLFAGIGLFAYGTFTHAAAADAHTSVAPGVTTWVAGVLLFVLACVLLAGHFTLQPNESCLLTLFGSYVGTVRDSGFHWTN